MAENAGLAQARKALTAQVMAAGSSLVRYCQPAQGQAPGSTAAPGDCGPRAAADVGAACELLRRRLQERMTDAALARTARTAMR